MTRLRSPLRAFTNLGFLTAAALALACSSGESDPRSETGDDASDDPSEQSPGPDDPAAPSEPGEQQPGEQQPGEQQPSEPNGQDDPSPNEPAGPDTPSTPDPVLGGSTEFESDDPTAAAQANGGLGGVATDGAAPPTASPNAPGAEAPTDADAPSGQDAARAIEEADIIKQEGDRLYALSRYGGLSVIDVSETDELRLLGRHKVLATPFEMYVRQGVAFVLYTGYGEYEESEDGNWTYFQTSYVVIVDTNDAANPVELGRFAIPGAVSDSRLVGDVLYVAAYENGDCWGCGSSPRTNLISLDVSDPTDIEAVDEVSFEERVDTYSWKRSLSGTDTRLYVAGPVWGNEQPEGSVIQVVDISDPGGNMELGASVEVAGQIESRWQMEEYEGVLRVVSQPFTWSTELVPVVQTFRIDSSEQLVPLASLPLVLPRPERLMSVRFDAERGYAITAERTDPLFTLDLSDPENPRQAGELEMPGWVYHMEPRGDRVLGLGYDQGNTDGALTVSLFDVSDLEAPTLVERVNFGGLWASLAEDQDRIHKSFRVLDDEGLLLVPFSGTYYESSGDACTTYQYVSGVQLVDWVDDDLSLRGVAPAVGQARRGFLLDERLFTVSDDRVQTFDISDRDAPTQVESLALALKVDQVAIAADSVVRVGQDWYSGTLQVDVASVSDADAPTALGSVEVPEVGQTSCEGDRSEYSYLEQVAGGDSAAYFLYRRSSYDYATGASTQGSRLFTIDVTEPSSPALVGDVELDFAPSYGYGQLYGMVTSGQPVISLGSALAFAQHTYDYDDQGALESQRHSVKVLDMTTPAAPLVTTLDLPDSRGATLLLKSGTQLALSHFEASSESPDKVRFYLDRIDVTDPAAPELLQKVNIPGSLLAFDSESNHAVTVDYRNDEHADVTAQHCQEVLGGYYTYPSDGSAFDYASTPIVCTTTTQILHLVAIGDDDLARIVDRHELPVGERVSAVALGQDRLFLGVGTQLYYGYAVDVAIAPGVGGLWYYPFTSSTGRLLVLSGIQSGNFEFAELELETGDSYGGYISQLAASGQRAVVATGWQGKLSVVDATSATEPRVLREVEIAGYASDLDLAGDTAVVSLGYDGVATVSLAD